RRPPGGPPGPGPVPGSGPDYLVRAVAQCGHARLRRPGRASPGPRQDPEAARTALAAADELAGWVEQMGGAPFADHPFVATIPAERATWEAERTRLAGPSDPAAW